MIQPGQDSSQFMMEIDRLAADLHRLGVRSLKELRKCVFLVVGLSADYEIKSRMLKNNSTGLNRERFEHVVWNP